VSEPLAAAIVTGKLPLFAEGLLEPPEPHATAKTASRTTRVLLTAPPSRRRMR
jgi:hypothetical protein